MPPLSRRFPCHITRRLSYSSTFQTQIRIFPIPRTRGVRRNVNGLRTRLRMSPLCPRDAEPSARIANPTRIVASRATRMYGINLLCLESARGCTVIRDGVSTPIGNCSYALRSPEVRCPFFTFTRMQSVEAFPTAQIRCQECKKASFCRDIKIPKYNGALRNRPLVPRRYQHTYMMDGRATPLRFLIQGHS